MQALFDARSVAVIGASDNPGRVGGMPLHFLLEGGFDGVVYAVNPRRDTVQGQPAFARLADIDAPVDLAVIVVPAAGVIEAVEECAAAGVGAAAVISSGFAEAGAEGERLQERLRAVITETGIRVCGPNCAGVMNLPRRMLASFGSQLAARMEFVPGSIAVVSQSGAVGAYLFTLARERGLGLSKWATTGNEIDLQAADLIEAIAADEETDVIALYLEQVRDGEALARACEAAHRNDKALVGVLAGRTSAADEALRSHTAAMAGDREVAFAALEELGIVVVDSIERLLSTAEGMRVGNAPVGPGVGLVTMSGAAGVMMVDESVDAGLDVPTLPTEVQERLREMLPFAATANPIDVTGSISNVPEIFDPFLSSVLASEDVDAVVCFLGHVLLSPLVGERLLLEVAAAAGRTAKPIWLVGVVEDPRLRKLLGDAGVPLFTDPVAAVDALGAAYRSVSRRRGDSSLPAARRGADHGQVAPPPRGALSEREAQEYLAPLGIRFPGQRLVGSAADAAAAAAEIGGPVVMKISSPDIAHKTDVGGVRLDVAPEDAADAYETVMAAVTEKAPGAALDGVLVQERVEGFPVIVGSRFDEAFGPVVLVGSGGIHAEAIDDQAIALAPLDVAGAEALLARTKLPPILSGARGGPPLACDRLVELIVTLSQLAWRGRDRILTVELNPVLVGATDVVAADALLETKGDVNGA